MSVNTRPLQRPTLPGLTATFANQRRKALGYAGEVWVMQELSKANWSVSLTKNGEHRGDIRAVHTITGEILKIEVKTARQGRDRKWRFTLVKQGCTDYRHADVLILLCALKSGHVVPFVIPVADIPGRRQMCITSHPSSYAGELARYRQTRGLAL